MAHYVKLFDTIIHSTIWQEDLHTKVVWITMLALADAKGEVHASIPGLARAAGVTIPQCQEALQKFLSPDPYSRTPVAEGRRIEVIDGGWELINYVKYGELKSAEQEKQNSADRSRRYRERQKSSQTVTDSHGESHDITPLSLDVPLPVEKGLPTPEPLAPTPALPVEKPKRAPKVKTTNLKPESVKAFQATWETIPKTVTRWDNNLRRDVEEEVMKGSRSEAERYFQAIVDSGVAKPRTLYVAFYAYINEGEGPKKGYIQHCATFFGPKKSTYLEWLDRARQLEIENYGESA